RIAFALGLAACTGTGGPTSNVIASTSSAQQTILSASRQVNWSGAGASGVTLRTMQCATIAAYTGSASAINTALASCLAGQVVLLGPGTFNLSSGIDFNAMSNVTLRGSGPDSTFLVFSNGTGCIGYGGANICLQNSAPVYPGSTPNVADWT